MEIIKYALDLGAVGKGYAGDDGSEYGHLSGAFANMKINVIERQDER